MKLVYLGVVLAPLIGSIIAGVFGKFVGRSGSHWATIIGVAISFILSVVTFNHVVIGGAPVFD